LDLQDGILTVVVAPDVVIAVVVAAAVVSIYNYENRAVNHMKGCGRILLDVDDSILLVELITVEDTI